MEWDKVHVIKFGDEPVSLYWEGGIFVNNMQSAHPQQPMCSSDIWH